MNIWLCRLDLISLFNKERGYFIREFVTRRPDTRNINIVVKRLLIRPFISVINLIRYDLEFNCLLLKNLEFSKTLRFGNETIRALPSLVNEDAKLRARVILLLKTHCHLP